MEVCGQLHAPAALSPGKSPRYPLVRRLGGLQIRRGRGGEDKNPCHCWESNSGCPTHSITTTLAKLTWLHGCCKYNRTINAYIFLGNLFGKLPLVKDNITMDLRK
jgi:hypothetical protein